MATLLYAEVYLICIIIVWLCLYWVTRRSSGSASERWLHITLVGFLVSFISNLLFTIFNGGRLIPGLLYPLSYFFKTVYHLALCFGVYAWCGYADTECRGKLFVNRRMQLLTGIPLLGMAALIISNLWTHRMFVIDEGEAYMRSGLFQLEMGLLVAFTLAFSIKLILRRQNETDPVKRSHMLLVASFPLCLLIAWALTFIGEGLPIICVTITIELLCLFMGTSTQQISMDKLTQVNNRQNLLGFLDYKLLNHDEKIFLLMMDLDYFKTINDTYGHLEGDDALIRAAQALKYACGSFKRRPYIARYGGDEFIVVIESTKAEAEALIARICETLSELNDQASRPYTLAFSIGVGEYHPGMNANDLIEAADHALYEIKRARPPRPR
ncbi:MAG: GGDEF domain-containing protein [Clostridia bacterium]|nr:GGDEF domain-containing protein [Clostridia bacterium]